MVDDISDIEEDLAVKKESKVKQSGPPSLRNDEDRKKEKTGDEPEDVDDKGNNKNIS
jgi:hypothetical protein